ncbi:MAG: hypothetical protein D6741_01430, partial [Planctomycetota bacterium]
MKAIVRIFWLNLFLGLGVGIAVLIARHTDAVDTDPAVMAPPQTAAPSSQISVTPAEAAPDGAPRQSFVRTDGIPATPSPQFKETDASREQRSEPVGANMDADPDGLVGDLKAAAGQLLGKSVPGLGGSAADLKSVLSEAAKAQGIPLPETPSVLFAEAQGDDQSQGGTEIRVLEATAPADEEETLIDPAAITPPTQSELDVAGPESESTDAASGSSPRVTVQQGGSSPEEFAKDERLDINFRDTDVREALETLSRVGKLNIIAGKSVTGQITASLAGVTADEALQAVLDATGYVAHRRGRFVFVGTPEDLKVLERAGDRVGTRVYRTKYVPAADLKELITPLLTPEIGVVAISSPAEVGIAPDSQKAGGDAYAGGDVVVVKDYEGVLREIDRVIEGVDRRPPQVAIEAMILSVKLDDTDKFGVSFELLRNEGHIKLGWGAPPKDSVGEVKLDGEGLKIGFLDSTFSTFVQALEEIGDTNVIASPHLMVVNKQKAEILIGQELGYVSTTITETSSSQSVEFLKVGAQLILRPFVSPDGLIRMEVHPELSTGSVEVTNSMTVPNKETTQVTTNIMVPDGKTVVIGGLMREDLKSSGNQVP